MAPDNYTGPNWKDGGGFPHAECPKCGGFLEGCTCSRMKPEPVDRYVRSVSPPGEKKGNSEADKAKKDKAAAESKAKAKVEPETPSSSGYMSSYTSAATLKVTKSKESLVKRRGAELKPSKKQLPKSSDVRKVGGKADEPSLRPGGGRPGGK